MNAFLQQHIQSVIGMVSGWDRLRFHGTISSICYATGLSRFLSCSGKMFKGFKEFALSSSEMLREAALRVAIEAGRPIHYLPNPHVSKEHVARICAAEDGIKEGLICAIKAVEPCYSFVLRKDRSTGQIDFRRAMRQGMHVYHYYQHPIFGLMHVRLQTWLPFGQFICVNGREWLSRQLDAAKIGYLRKENCFIHIDDIPATQELLNQQVHFNWRPALDQLAHGIAPVIAQVLAPYQISYYWTIQESEWATDFMFNSQKELSNLYPKLLHHGLQSFGSRDVMRFLGQKVPLQGNSFSVDRRQMVSDLKERPEGIRVKHRLGSNSVKMYNKQGSVLRIETTLNNITELKAPRRHNGQVVWMKMRKSVADARQRAQVSEAANQRYVEAIASIEAPETLQVLTESLSQPVRWKKQRVRGLNLLGEEDSKLLQTVARAEFLINGFRNRDLRVALFAAVTTDPVEKQRRCSQITRRLRMLRAHGLIQKMPHTHRYMVSDKGRRVITALIAARQSDVTKLSKAA